MPRCLLVCINSTEFQCFIVHLYEAWCLVSLYSAEEGFW